MPPESSWLPDPEEISRVDRILEETYGAGGHRSRLLLGQVGADPVDILLATVLSQATADRASLQAFRRLKQRFPDWGKALEVSPAELEKLISPAGLHRQKAARILSILKALRARAGRVSLDFLREEDPSAARGFLETLPGVGPKTAACVLLFGLGKPAFPVDTHVHRVATRLGLVPRKADRARAQKMLQEATSPEAYFRLHVNLIAHGREVCRARRPRCQECPLNRLCPAASLPEGNRVPGKTLRSPDASVRSPGAE